MIAGIAQTNQPTVTKSYFDPLVEFLELGVNVNGVTTWKIYGPDLNGRNGGLDITVQEPCKPVQVEGGAASSSEVLGFGNVF